MSHQIDRTLAILQDVMNAHTLTLSRKAEVPGPVVIPSLAEPRATLIERVLSQLEERFGLDINRTLAEKLLRLLEPIGPADLPAYVDTLERTSSEHPEWISLVDRLIVGETYFLRDWDQLDFFCKKLGDLIMQAERARQFTLRFWSIGCASGEEAFTIAALALRVLAARGSATESENGIILRDPWRVEVLGCDISRRALVQAQQATYETGPLSSFRNALGDLDRFFPVVLQHGANGSRPMRTVHPCVRSVVQFRPFNLASDAVPNVAFDVVSCRNILVSFSPRARRIAQARLSGAVRPGGLLLLGPTDALADDLEFEALWSTGAVIHRRRRRD
jgi:chemotaxis protein methyltransferase CheR